ncbi:uncharacterized protein LOC142335319 isoform X2 [Convolutriloba macropyga]|uniref:uncharacterized protein LOC142335319 isoform X2 n=1 Tax=Convolutriloba macropyga TaxID=536237 RepID=UPI003F5230EE
MKNRYYPLVIWTLLYISVVLVLQGTIGIYGFAFANISELAKYEPRLLRPVQVGWVVCVLNFCCYIFLISLFLCGVTVKKYKGHSTKRLEDWIAVLMGVNTMSTIVNGLSTWGYGFIPFGTLHTLLIRERPCCFAGHASSFLSNPGQHTDVQGASGFLSCVCTDFSECFSDQPSSECSRQIEQRVATYCYMLQVMQYTTSVFLVVEICLLIHATVLIFKANQEHPINQEKFRTYSEYKAIRESYRKEKEMRRHTNATFISSTAGGGHFEELIENNELETNYDENVITENDHGWDTDRMYDGRDGVDSPTDENPILPELSPKRQAYKTRWSTAGDYPTPIPTSSHFGGQSGIMRQHSISSTHSTRDHPPFTSQTQGMGSDMSHTPVDFSASGGSAELRTYLRNAPSILDSEHTAETLARSFGGGSMGRYPKLQNPATWSGNSRLPPNLRSQSLQPMSSIEMSQYFKSGIEGGGLRGLQQQHMLGSISQSEERNKQGSRKSIVDVIPRVWLTNTIPKRPSGERLSQQGRLLESCAENC